MTETKGFGSTNGSRQDACRSLNWPDPGKHRRFRNGYAMARAEQIRRARWQDVDLKVGAIELGVDPDARKSDAARRVIPAVPPLLALLRRAYLEAGRPDGGELLCPPRYRARKSGLLSTNGLAKRARKQWGAAKLEPITLQECRHTAATWLDAAGVSPKIASYLMGHTNPSKQDGAATITLARYMRTLPDDIEKGARATRRIPGAGGERGHRLTVRSVRRSPDAAPARQHWPGGLASLVFETSAFDRSATPPGSRARC